MKWLLWIFAVVVLVDLWVRIAPSSVDKWHVAEIDATAPKRIGYFKDQVFEGAANVVLAQLDGIVLATPRTRVLAGSVDERQITYVTRSRLFGFPDYTTVWAQDLDEGSRITFYGRLRFGYGDQGVNRHRIMGWVQALEAFQ